MSTKDISKYIRRAKRMYYGDRELKKRFITDLQDSLLCFSEEHPDYSYKDLVNQFGSPREIKESFLVTSSKELKKRDIVLYRFAIICSIVIMIAALTFTAYHVKKNYDYSQGYVAKSITDESQPEQKLKSIKQTPIENYTFD